MKVIEILNDEIVYFDKVQVVALVEIDLEEKWAEVASYFSEQNKPCVLIDPRNGRECFLFKLMRWDGCYVWSAEIIRYTLRLVLCARPKQVKL